MYGVFFCCLFYEKNSISNHFLTFRSVRSAETPKISSNFWMAGTVRADHSARMGYASLTDGKGVLKRQLENGDGTVSGTGQGGALKMVIEKPDKFVKCPITGKQLEFSQLTDGLQNDHLV